MKRLLILLTLLMFTLPNCTNTSEDSENIFNNNENTTQDKTEEEEVQKEITLTSSKLTNVTIKTPPVKTEYTAGETFAPAGLTLTANYTDTYSDQSTKPSAKDLAYADIQNDLTFTGTDFAAAGTATVTVTYKGKNATFDVTIKEAPEQNIDIDYADDIDISGYGENINLTINVKTENIDLAELSALKTTSNAKTLTFSIPEETKVALKGADISTLASGTYGNIEISSEGKNFIAPETNMEYSLTLTNIDVSRETQLELSGPISLLTTKIKNNNENTNISLNSVKFVNQYVNRGGNMKDTYITTSDLIETFNNLLPSGQTMSPVLESHPTTLSTAFSSLPQLDLELNMENVSGDSKLKNQYINILKEYYDNGEELKDIKVFQESVTADGREGKAVDDIVGLYDDKNQFNDPNNPECTTPTTLPVYDVGFLKFANIQGVDGFKNIVVTGDVTSDTTTDLDFTNVVFTGDVSGIDNTGTYEGVIHFKDEPMKDIYSEYALIKIDTPPTGKRAHITGGIVDFRDIKDRLDDLTSDSDYDISNHLSLNGANKIARGYFKDERLKDYIEPRVETEAASFAGTYTEDVPEREQYMKTLREIENAANGKGEYSLKYLIDEGHNTVTRTE